MKRENGMIGRQMKGRRRLLEARGKVAVAAGGFGASRGEVP